MSTPGRRPALPADLLDAIVAVGADLDLPGVLERIVESACGLTNARYGALGVISSSGEELVEFVATGVTDEDRALIGHPPRGRGVLGLLLEQPEPVRVPVISEHPRAVGFPPHHPPMRSFLGVPVRVGAQVFGNLYLADKVGAEEFDHSDESVVVALAAAAAVAIEHARTFARGERRRRLLQAATEIGTALLADDTGEATASTLRLVLDRACDATESTAAAVVLLDETTPEPRVLRRTTGAPGSDADHLPWTFDGSAPPLSDVLRGDTVTLPGGLGVPITAGDLVVGALVLTRRDAARPYDAEDVVAASGLAAQVGLGLARARSATDRQLVAMLADRERIARDLHDVVIQRLFGTGLGLQGAARLAVREEVRSAIDEAVDVIDDVIREIRTTIFELHHAEPGLRLGARVEMLVEEATTRLGFAPDVRLAGRLDRADHEPIRSHVVAVVREALSNIVRHSRATAATLEVVVGDDAVTVTVTDDGVGIGGVGRRSGLANLGRRAAECGGGFEAAPGPDGRGTVVSWWGPLADAGA